MRDCRCAIALRVQSTLACEALVFIHKTDPKAARRLIERANEHARRLRDACDRGDHGPQEKRIYQGV